MARQTVIHLIDDVDGSSASETLSFEFNHVSYEIDLSEANAERFRKDLEPWVTSARRIGGRRGRPKVSQMKV